MANTASLSLQGGGNTGKKAVNVTRNFHLVTIYVINCALYPKESVSETPCERFTCPNIAVLCNFRQPKLFYLANS